MIASVNCLILGEASKNNFNVVVGEVYTNDDKIDVAFDQFTVSNLKELLFRMKKVKKAVQDPDSMDLYKVELSLLSLKDKIYTIDKIKDLVPTIVAPTTVKRKLEDLSEILDNKKMKQTGRAKSSAKKLDQHGEKLNQFGEDIAKSNLILELKMHDILLENIKKAEEYLNKDQSRTTENFKDGLNELFSKAKTKMLFYESLDTDVCERTSFSIPIFENDITDKKKLVISIEIGEIKKNSEKSLPSSSESSLNSLESSN
ncbi:hypothetical protein C1645_820467 [Glomus cerebriforme]|uniref:Uncharacterized protein n=1 Tax=Glomus cerebriforme TaxID=658196 RepID=A0A397T482_9GLOM|nr:hypothetical protein C1645_820467 [Glomus cerebriforme]